MKKDGSYLDLLTRLNICTWHTNIALENNEELQKTIDRMERNTHYGFSDPEEVKEIKEASKKGFIKQYTNQTLSSYIVMAHSAIESNVVDICRYLLKRDKIDLDIRSINGSPIKKLEVVVRLCKTKQISKEAKQFFEDLNNVRNIIVHSNGEIRSENELDTIKKIISRNPIFEENRKHIEFDKGKYFEYAKNIRKYLEEIMNLDEE